MDTLTQLYHLNRRRALRRWLVVTAFLLLGGLLLVTGSSFWASFLGWWILLELWQSLRDRRRERVLTRQLLAEERAPR